MRYAGGRAPWGKSHSTPALLTLHGTRQVVFLSTTEPPTSWDAASPTLVSSFDPEDGELLWRTEVLLSCLPIPGPIRIDDERIFVTGGYRSGSKLLRIVEDGEAVRVEQEASIGRGSQVHAPILHEGHLYLVANENWTSKRPRKHEGGLMCLGLDGEEKWRTGDEPYFGWGNMILAGRHLVLLDGDTGVLRVVDPTPSGYTPVAEAPLFTDVGSEPRMWAPLALANGLLVLRSQDELVCVRL